MKLYFSRALGLAALGLAITGCESETVELTVLHTNDLHSQLHAPKADPFRLGGLARLATLVTERREKAGERVVVLDAGDWSEGAWHYSLDTGANMLRFLGQIGFDATVLGNHDYLGGPDRTLQTVIEANSSSAVLASNLNFSQYPRQTEYRERIPRTQIIERGGLKIGIIGLTCVDFEYKSYLEPLIVTDPVQDAQERAKILRPLVDVLIVVSHNTFELNEQVARSTVGVDAVISGHSHKKVSQAVMVESAGRKVPVVEVGSWGTFLGELKLRVDLKKKKIDLKSYELLPVFSTIPEDPVVRAMVEIEDQRLSEFYGSDAYEVVAHSDAVLEHNDSHEPGMGDLAVKSYRALVPDVDLAIELIPLTGIRLAEGPLTVKDLHDVMPHIYNHETRKEWTVRVWEANGADIGLLANVFYTVTNLLPIGAGGFLAGDGWTVIWDPKRPGNPVAKVKEIWIGDRPLDMTRTYRVAISDGFLHVMRLAKELLHLNVDLSRITDTEVEAWRAIVEYARSKGVLRPDELRAGGASHTITADPAVFAHGIRWANDRLSVRVDNNGLQEADGLVLKCFKGVKDDFTGYETETEKPYTPIGELGLAPLPAGVHYFVDMPWDPVPGFWPVECRIEAAMDGYPGNSRARKVLEVR